MPASNIAFVASATSGVTDCAAFTWVWMATMTPLARSPADPLDAGTDVVRQPVLGKTHQRLGGQPDVADVLDLQQAGEERLQPRPRHVRDIATRHDHVPDSRRTTQVVEHVVESLLRLRDELQLVD